MAINNWRINEFFGIDQHLDGSLIDDGMSPMARNMDTSDGNLNVAKGFAPYYTPILNVNSNSVIYRIWGYPDICIAIARLNDTFGLYNYKKDGSTELLWEYNADDESEAYDAIRTAIGNDDYFIVANGKHQMIKHKIGGSSAEYFGTGDTSYKGKISAFVNISSGTLLTLNAPLSATAQRMALAYGVRIDGARTDVISVNEDNPIQITVKPIEEIALEKEIIIDGGLSDKPVNYICSFNGRLFAAGDSNFPNRLYWSTVPGDGRIIEDWQMIDTSEDLSGGHVDIGQNRGDPIIGIKALSSQILIFKSRSIWRLYGDRPSTFTVECIETDTEFMAHTSVCVEQDTAYWLNVHGIYYYNGSIVKQFPSNQYIRKFLDGLASVRQSKGIICRDIMYFTAREKYSSRVDDVILVYDTIRGTFMLRDGFYIRDIITYDGAVFIINDNCCLYKFNQGIDYDGEPILAYWKAPYTDRRAKNIDKQIRSIHLSGNGSLDITLICGSIKIKRRAMLNGNDYEDWIVQAPMTRAFGLEFSNVFGSSFSLNGGVDIIYSEVKKL